MDLVTALIQNQTLFVRHVRQHMNAILCATGERRSHSYTHENYKYAALSMTALYSVRHLANGLYRDKLLLADAIKLANHWFDALDQDPSISDELCEWPCFISTRMVELLGANLDDRFVHRARNFVSVWIECCALNRPFGTTSPNHEAWRCLGLLCAGRQFENSAWEERALFFLRQLCTSQTKEGFWEEGRHHGPSMKYNCLMLAPLAIMYRMTGEEWIAVAAKKLAQFMAAFTFPDGTTVGSFDGRQSTSPAFWSPVCPGLELAQEGATLNERGAELWRLRGMLNEPRAIGPSNWYTHFGSFFGAESILYFSKYPNPTGAAPLAMDHRKACLENHSSCFDGVMRRSGPWIVAVSGQESNVPADSPGRFRLERESRMEAWHEKAGVVAGGGHNMVDAEIPLANVILDPNPEPRSNFGKFEQRDGKQNRLLYLARAAKSQMVENETQLSVHFAHGLVSWRLLPSEDSSFLIEAAWEVLGVSRLNLQIPIVLWRKAMLHVNRERVVGTEPGLTGLIQAATVCDAYTKTTVNWSFPENGLTRMRLGLPPLRTYGQLFLEEHFDSPFHILLASTQFENPQRKGTATWKINIA